MHNHQQNLKLLAKNHIDNHELQAARQLLIQARVDDEMDAEALFLLGFVEAALGSTGQAVDCFTASLRLAPSFAASHFHLAVALDALGQLTSAAAHFEDCLAIDPKVTAARRRVSDIYNRLGDQERSGWHLEQLLQQEPDNPGILIRYAYNRMSLGMLETAEECLRRALEEKPGATMAVAGLSEIFIMKGGISNAFQLLEPFLERRPVEKGIALSFARICHHVDRCGQAVHLLEDVCKDMQASTGDPRDVLFALGRLYDKQQQYDKAFACYARANRLKGVSENLDLVAQQADTFIDTWSLSFDAGLPSAAVRFGQLQPIFIVGMPRSGTSLVEQILASHPAVHGGGELKDIGTYIQQFPDLVGAEMPFPGCLSLAGSYLMDEFAAKYLQKVASLAGQDCLMITDKMPANCWNLGFIRKLFPAAKIIHCQRAPLDTCLSCYFTDFAEGHHYTFDLLEMGGYYRQYQRIMRHWKETIQVPMLEVQYEALVSQPEESIRQLVSYCGLDWDDKCLMPHKTRRDVTTASFTQVREEIYTSSVNRWGHYEEYIGLLREALDM